MSELEENVAQELLARGGIAVIWEAHVAADAAYRVGNVRAADILMNIADAAETIWRGKSSYDTAVTRSLGTPGVGTGGRR